MSMISKNDKTMSFCRIPEGFQEYKSFKNIKGGESTGCKTGICNPFSSSPTNSLLPLSNPSKL